MMASLKRSKTNEQARSLSEEIANATSESQVAALLAIGNSEEYAFAAPPRIRNSWRKKAKARIAELRAKD